MTGIPLTAADVPAAVALLSVHPDYRVLARLPRPYSDLPDTLPEGARWIAIVDVETEGCDPLNDQIIELAIMHVAVGEDGTVLGHSRPQSWLQDPGRPLSEQISKLTGLTDADLAGQVLDEKTIIATLARCSLAVAHNSAFDIGFMDRRFPTAATMPWACSLNEIPWGRLGLSCRKLGHLLLEHYAFYSAHRAEADVWATAQLLQRAIEPERAAAIGVPVGTTYFKLLLDSSDEGCVRLRAHGLPFDQKDWVKARGFKWDPLKRLWWKDFTMADYMLEKAAFADAGLPEPVGTALDAVQRYRV